MQGTRQRGRRCQWPPIGSGLVRGNAAVTLSSACPRFKAKTPFVRAHWFLIVQMLPLACNSPLWAPLGATLTQLVGKTAWAAHHGPRVRCPMKLIAFEMQHMLVTGSLSHHDLPLQTVSFHGPKRSQTGASCSMSTCSDCSGPLTAVPMTAQVRARGERGAATRATSAAGARAFLPIAPPRAATQTPPASGGVGPSHLGRCCESFARLVALLRRRGGAPAGRCPRSLPRPPSRLPFKPRSSRCPSRCRLASSGAPAARCARAAGLQRGRRGLGARSGAAAALRCLGGRRALLSPPLGKSLQPALLPPPHPAIPGPPVAAV